LPILVRRRRLSVQLLSPNARFPAMVSSVRSDRQNGAGLSIIPGKKKHGELCQKFTAIGQVVDSKSMQVDSKSMQVELLPCHLGWQLDAHAFLQWFSVFHRDALGGVIAQVVALLEQCSDVCVRCPTWPPPRGPLWPRKAGRWRQVIMIARQPAWLL
jgi:hypothetical protein